MDEERLRAPPPDVVRDFDHHGQAYRERPLETLRELRQTCPFAWSEHHGGFWVATRYETVLQVSRNLDAFSSAEGTVIPTVSDRRFLPIESDPPELQDIRALLVPLFAPRPMQAEGPRLRAEAASLVEAMRERGEGDVVLDLAQPLTGRTTLRLIGLPEDEWHDYAGPIHDITMGSLPMDLASANFEAMVERMRAEIRRLHNAPPEGSVLERLFAGEILGRRLSLEEIDGIVLLLLGGGLDTSQALIGSAAVHLGRTPAHRQRLIEDPSRMDDAIEEFLRLWPPTQAQSRTCTRATQLMGQTVRPGERVLMSYAAANRDPAQFESPESVDLARHPNRQLAFGIGPHRCLGSHLARLEIDACLRALLAGIPDYRLREDELVFSRDPGLIYGYLRVPITF